MQPRTLFCGKSKPGDLGESKRQLSGHKRMLNRLAAIYNFRRRNLKLDHCQRGGLAAGLLEHTHSAGPLQDWSGPVVNGMNEGPEGLVAMA